MKKNFKPLCLVLSALMMVSILINLNTGFVDLSFSDFWLGSPLYQEIADLRINRTLAVLLAGVSIPTSGFLLQEYFKNPLAGPSVLGITSVAGLFVAFYLLASQNIPIPEFLQNGFISLSAVAGALLLMVFLVFLSHFFRDGAHLVIFGFLVSALSGAVISILQFYAGNEALRGYLLWSFGGNIQLERPQLFILALLIFLGLVLTFKSIKPLIGMGLGENYARSFGVDVHRLKILVIMASSLLSASVTAFLGPVLFIGVIVPHFCRMIWNPAQLWHQWMLNMLLGILVMNIFSALSEKFQLPANIISSLFGIPVLLVMLLRQKFIKSSLK